MTRASSTPCRGRRCRGGPRRSSRATQRGPGTLDEFLLCRRINGRLVAAGRARFGLDRRRHELRRALALLEIPGGRGAICNVTPLLQVDVAHHGAPGGELRDPVMRNVHVG